jgi:hypothetical protein
MGIEVRITSPTLRAGEVDGAKAPRVRVIGSAQCVKVERGDPITLAASRLELSRAAGEVS